MNEIRRYIRQIALPVALLSFLMLCSCGDEKANKEDCRAVCLMIQQCEPQAYVTEERLAVCYAGCDNGSIYMKKDYSVCLAEESGSCEDFDACLLAVDSGAYEEDTANTGD